MAQQHIVQLNYLKMAPRKVRLLGDVLKGLPVQEAEAQLLLRNRRAGGALLKLLRSAVAGAKVKKMAVEKLLIAAVRVDQGPMMKRGLPRALGRATPIQKKMSHVTLILTEGDKIHTLRYNIATVKKEKKKKVKKQAAGAEKQEKEMMKTKVEQKPGFFQKVFRRKSV